MRKTALITGASSGIGRELAIIHAQHGDDVILVARSQQKLQQLQQQLQHDYAIHAHIFVTDLSRPNAALELYQHIQAVNLRVDYLINNAGFADLGIFHEKDWHSKMEMIQVNIVALTQFTHLWIPHFLQQGGGKILNVSSAVSSIPGPLQAVYYASKAYVSSFSNALAGELEHTPISVTTLLPGATESGFAARSGMDKTALFHKTTKARDVALAGYRGMLKGQLDVYVGLSLLQRIMLKIAPLMPKLLVLRQVKHSQMI